MLANHSFVTVIGSGEFIITKPSTKPPTTSGAVWRFHEPNAPVKTSGNGGTPVVVSVAMKEPCPSL
jgi:hypothetical protein